MAGEEWLNVVGAEKRRKKGGNMSTHRIGDGAHVVVSVVDQLGGEDGLNVA